MEQDQARREMIDGQREIELVRSLEYGAWIIESVEKNVPITIHGNVPNGGLIENLPADGCVEVACHIDRNRVQPTKFGRLPKQMAAICESNMRMFDLAADACVQGSRELAELALMLDPLTAACCCPAEIRSMFGKMFAAEREYLLSFS